jgi:hypothetical protein
MVTYGRSYGRGHAPPPGDLPRGERTLKAPRAEPEPLSTSDTKSSHPPQRTYGARAAPASRAENLVFGIDIPTTAAIKRAEPRAHRVRIALRHHFVQPKTARRLTHAITRPIKRRMVEDFGFGVAHEMFGISADKRYG